MTKSDISFFLVRIWTVDMLIHVWGEEDGEVKNCQWALDSRQVAGLHWR